MGTTTSLPDTDTKLSNEEIRNTIDKLFINNRNNAMSDSTLGTLNFNNYTRENNIDIDSIAGMVGGSIPNIKFNPKKQRYLNYDINSYVSNLRQQKGGYDEDENDNNNNNVDEEEYESIESLEEFKKLRDYLRNQINTENSLNKNNMEAVVADIDDYKTDSISGLLNNPILSSPDTITEQKNRFDVLKIMKGGAENDDSSSSSDSDDDEDDHHDKKKHDKKKHDKKKHDKKKHNKDDEDEDDHEDDEDDDEDDDHEDNHDDDNENDDDDDDDDDDDQDGGNSDLSYMSSSYNSNSSDINILPFYSQSSSSNRSFQHPYVKNRFK